MTLDTVSAHKRAQELFAGVLNHVPDDAWDQASACERWTIRDIAGHVVWGLQLARTCAEGNESADRRGSPGSDHPAVVLDEHPTTAFAAERERCNAALTQAGTEQPGPAMIRKALPEATIGDFLPNLASDMVIHSWDIASRIGVRLEVDPDLLELAQSVSGGEVPRGPAFFGDAVSPPEDLDPFQRLLAHLGRDPRSATPVG